MGGISRGWQLTKLSFSVIRKDKELLLFPLISGIITILLAISFFLPFILSTDWNAGASPEDSEPTLLLLFIPFYIIAYFIAIFFNVAIVACATKRLDGGDPTFSYGIGFAKSRLKYIFQWAIFAAIVGLILRAIQQRVGAVGKILVALAGLAWSIATYFVIPVIAFEEMTPLNAIKRSAGILRKSWGEALISNLGMGLIFFVFSLVGFLIIILGFAIGGLMGLAVGAIVAVIYWVFIGVLATAAQNVLMAALYRFATTGKTSMEFPTYVLENPWTV